MCCKADVADERVDRLETAMGYDRLKNNIRKFKYLIINYNTILNYIDKN